MYKKSVKQCLVNNIQWSIDGISPAALKEILDSIETGKHCEVVRAGYLKKISRYSSDLGIFYVKQYTIKPGMDSLRSLFSVSKAQREWDRSFLLMNYLNTAEPVAIGERRRWEILKDCYIISKAIQNSVSVKGLLTERQQFSDGFEKTNKTTFLSSLIAYVKTMHDSGIFHGELHAENILVNKNDCTLFYLLDLGRAQRKRKLSLSLRILDVSRLLYSIMDVCTSEEIDVLISNYIPSPQKDGGVFRKAVLHEIFKIRHRLWLSRTKKCLKNNNVFRALTYGCYRVNMRNEWDIDTLLVLINKHILSTKERSNDNIKISSKTNVTRIHGYYKEFKGICIKEYKYISLLKKILYSFNNSPAKKAWFAAHGLTVLKFQTPKPIALLEEKRGGIIIKSFFVMEDISDCMPCNKYISETFGNFSDKTISRKKQRFIACLARSFRRLHDSNVFHHDLKANNIMIKELQDDWDFFYLDLDRVCFHKKITPGKKIKNLSQLNASLPNYITYTDRIRFYRIYTGINELSVEDKQMLRMIIRLSLRRNHVWNARSQAAG